MNGSTTEMPTESITVTNPEAPGRSMDTHLALPSGSGPFPGVVVIHEIFGLNQNIRDVVGRFAAEGYAAMAVDLFSTGNRVACLIRIMYGMILRPLKNGVLGDLGAAIDFLGKRSDVDETRIGVIGFCMGGGYALQLACVEGDRSSARGRSLRAASVFYGSNPRPLEAVAQACPIVGSYAKRDFTAGAARKLDEVLEKFNIDRDIKIYPDARHSFFNDRGASHHPQAAADSWARTLAFFDTHLRNKQTTQ